MDNNLSEFIRKERERKEQENPQPVQSPTNVRNALFALKNAVDGYGSLEGNPLIENIKKVENVVERKEQAFIKPIVGQQQLPKQTIVENNINFDEKDDKFTKDLLMKTRQFITANTNVNSNIQPIIKEETYHPKPIQPDYMYNHTNQANFNVHNNISKSEILSALKDTITDLYVKERVESIIREYLQTDEGKMLIKSIVVGLFKRK